MNSGPISSDSLIKKESKNYKNDFRSFFLFLKNLFKKKTRKSFVSLISYILQTHEKEKVISSEQRKMIKNIASLSDKKVADIMTTRADIVAINKDASLEEIKKTVVLDGHTRIPVFGENLDEILGFIHSKDLSKFLCKEDSKFALQDIIRKILFIPGSMKIVDLLLKMRNQRVHIAIVMDEYGGVDGLVTIENVMEEIVGEIEDEHDLPSDNIFFKIKKIDDKITHVGGRVEIEKIEKILGLKLRKKSEEFETVGGLITFLFNEIPAVGEEIKRDKINFKILDSDSRSVKLVEFKIS